MSAHAVSLIKTCWIYWWIFSFNFDRLSAVFQRWEWKCSLFSNKQRNPVRWLSFENFHEAAAFSSALCMTVNRMILFLGLQMSLPFSCWSIQPWTTCCRPWQRQAVLRPSGQEAQRTSTALKLEMSASQGAADAAGNEWRNSPYPPTPLTMLPSPCPVQGTTELNSGFRSKVSIPVGLNRKRGKSLWNVFVRRQHLFLCHRKCFLWGCWWLLRWPKESR